jgi:hypothetical protein
LKIVKEERQETQEDSLEELSPRTRELKKVQQIVK